MYRHILIATDGSSLATRAAKHGLALAKALGAQVTAVTVTGLWSASEMAARAARGTGALHATISTWFGSTVPIGTSPSARTSSRDSPPGAPPTAVGWTELR